MGHGEVCVPTRGVKAGKAELCCPVKVGGRGRQFVFFQTAKGVGGRMVEVELVQREGRVRKDRED